MFRPTLVFTALASALVMSSPAAESAGIAPVGSDGKPLNLGFESGTLSGWTATGEAWAKQPVKGDVVKARRDDMRSEHAGNFWVGSYESAGDDATGTLTSQPFKVTQPWASFLVGGGDSPETRVEIVTKDDGKVIHTARGTQRENLARSVVDLRKVTGRDIFIRIVDDRKDGWGHVNFDDFVFHDSEPKFTNVVAKAAADFAADQVEFAGLSAADAVKTASLPEGFEMQVVAAEPDLVNPISFCLDDRGRAWVVEGMTYPNRAKDGEGKDRILVFEDTDGDGKADKRTVFMDKLNLVSGIEVGFGGVWIGAAPNFMFIPITDGPEPRPAGEPKILLDGWGYQDTHETLNTFRWGPDGWLYGCHGVFTHSKVGKPGTPDGDRKKINAGFWRYHPARHEFEVFAEGTSNSWGIDFDSHGQLFAEACVIPHLFHVIQGARYQRQAGQHFNPHTYDDIKTIADHRHYVGANPHGGNGKSDSLGGGHAHAGLMIYQGDGWPEAWRGRIMMGNIHGQRINADVPERIGSGFVGHHGPDFINFKDRASQVVDIRQGPDGSAYMIDWYDLNQCHRPQREAHDYTTGRLYKIVTKGARKPAENLAAKTDRELGSLSISTDAWKRTHSRRLLQERHPAAASINEALGGAKTADEQLYALWTRHAIGADDENVLATALKASGEYERSWAIQFAAEDGKLSDGQRVEFARLAKSDVSPIVRLYLASATQRLPVDQRLPILEPMLAQDQDVKDGNLPLMYWYALEPVVGADPAQAATLLSTVKIPLIQEYIARRMATTASVDVAR